jgi:hypothetical protein
MFHIQQIIEYLICARNTNIGTKKVSEHLALLVSWERSNNDSRDYDKSFGNTEPEEGTDLTLGFREDASQLPLSKLFNLSIRFIPPQ